MDNFTQNIDFKYQYRFSIIICCLMLKLGQVIQFNPEIGPLLKIVQKMANDFINFMVIYALLLIMFSLIGNLNFLFYCPEYETLFNSFITLLDSSMGNYDFGVMA